jgi:sporulation protein YlmC with PRC-barrel domain
MQRKLTNQLLAAAGAVVMGGLLSAGPVLAQVSPQPIPLVRVNVQKMASGYRSSEIVGSSVVNQHNEKIGMVDDLIIEPSEKVPFAILSVGGFLGVGERLVVVPFDSLKISQDMIELPGATKDELEAMPEFSYAKK